MQFNKKQMAAILKMDKAMALADGKFTNAERNVIKLNLMLFGVSTDTLESMAIEQCANTMEFSESVAILSTMSLDQKRFVCGYMATIMAVDYDISDKELALWKLMSVLCGFPETNIQDAIKVYSENYM